MKKVIITTILTVILTAFSCLAQDDFYQAITKLTDQAPNRYVAANTNIVVNPASACNQGEEPFADFIKRFRNDKTFRTSRIRLAFNNEEQQQCLSQQTEEDWKSIKASRTRRSQGMVYYNTWYNVKADEVCFISAQSCPENVAEGLAYYYQFRRINNKWYLVTLTETAR